MFKSSIVYVGFFASAIFASSAQAECYCACINNETTKVCENSWDSNYVYCNGTYCSGNLEDPTSELKDLLDYIEVSDLLYKFDTSKGISTSDS